MPYHIIHNDITLSTCDAIVNAANRDLLAGGGVCGAIFKRANDPRLQQECLKYAPIQTSEAIITSAYQLPSQYIIHAVGPIYQDGKHHEDQLLYNTYMNALNLAYKHDLHSIAFPLISSGIYGYPKKEALMIATKAFKDFLKDHDMRIELVVYDRQSVTISEELYKDVIHYIDTYYHDERRLYEASFNRSVPFDLETLINQIKPSFSELLFHYIDQYQYNDVDVYKKANIDRKLFSKMKNKNYHPSKKTVFALSIALELSLDETMDLLESAGYSLSYSSKQDIIIRYFIEHQDYDIYKINETLFQFQLPIL